MDVTSFRLWFHLILIFFLGKVVNLDGNLIHVIIFENCEPSSDKRKPTLLGLQFVVLNYNAKKVLNSETWKVENVYIVNKTHFLSRDLIYRAGLELVYGIDSIIKEGSSVAVAIEQGEFPVSTVHYSFGLNGQDLDMNFLLSMKQIDINHSLFMFRCDMAEYFNREIYNAKGKGRSVSFNIRAEHNHIHALSSLVGVYQDYSNANCFRQVKVMRNKTFSGDMPKRQVLLKFANSASLVPFLGANYCVAPIECKLNHTGDVEYNDFSGIVEVNGTTKFSSGITMEYDINSSILHVRANTERKETNSFQHQEQLMDSVTLWSVALKGKYFCDSLKKNELIRVVKVELETSLKIVYRNKISKKSSAIAVSPVAWAVSHTDFSLIEEPQLWKDLELNRGGLLKKCYPFEPATLLASIANGEVVEVDQVTFEQLFTNSLNDCSVLRKKQRVHDEVVVVSCVKMVAYLKLVRLSPNFKSIDYVNNVVRALENTSGGYFAVLDSEFDNSAYTVNLIRTIFDDVFGVTLSLELGNANNRKTPQLKLKLIEAFLKHVNEVEL